MNISINKKDLDDLFIHLDTKNFNDSTIYNNICCFLKNNKHFDGKNIWSEWFMKNIKLIDEYNKFEHE